MPPVPPGRLARLQRPVLWRMLRTPAIVGWMSRSRSQPIDGAVLDPQIAAMLHFDDLNAVSGFGQDTPDEARARFAASLTIVDGDPPPGVDTRGASVAGPGGPIALRIYEPAGLAAPSPALVYFHSGGYVLGDLDTHDTLCRTLALEAGARIIAVDYRRAPEHPFPAAAQDCLAAFRGIAARAGELGVDPARLGLLGESNGANLAAAVAAQERKGAVAPALQVLLYPALDLAFRGRSYQTFATRYYLTSDDIAWFRRHYLPPGADPAHPDISSLHRDDLAGQCPAFIVTAGFDPTRDDGTTYAERLRRAGVPVEHRAYPTLIHGFCVMTGAIDAAREATVELARTAGALLANPPR